MDKRSIDRNSSVLISGVTDMESLAETVSVDVFLRTLSGVPVG